MVYFNCGRNFTDAVLVDYIQLCIIPYIFSEKIALYKASHHKVFYLVVLTLFSNSNYENVSIVVYQHLTLTAVIMSNSESQSSVLAVIIKLLMMLIVVYSTDYLPLSVHVN